MAKETISSALQFSTSLPDGGLQVIRHQQVCTKLQLSSAKLFDMVARGQFPKPFRLVPGGRAVGWLKVDVDNWVLSRKADSLQAGAV